jgi:hypothetical protein
MTEIILKKFIKSCKSGETETEVILTENQTVSDILLVETPKPRLLQQHQLQYIRWYQRSLVQAFRAIDKQIS